MLRRLRQDLREVPVFIVGSGHWGRALGGLFERSFRQVSYADERTPRTKWTQILQKNPIVVLACPFVAIPETLKKLRNQKPTLVINASKGIDQKSLLTFTGMARKSKISPIATLSGPTFAKEVQEQKPTACVLAGKDHILLSKIAELISTPKFRVYLGHDSLGVEASGAIKNVLAIACGLSDGLNLGLNARAALLTRGLVEMSTLVRLLGGKAETVFGLAGVGDLWLTATGDLSRNRQLGLQLAQGLSLPKALSKLSGTCEGVYTVKQVHALSKKHMLDLPISEQVYKICFKDQNPKQALLELMTRALKPEASNGSKVR